MQDREMMFCAQARKHAKQDIRYLDKPHQITRT
jgi:hypothetical protein